MKFNHEVLEGISNILERLQCLEAKLNDIPGPPPGQQCELPGVVHSLEERIASMEILLSRTTLADFNQIDKVIEGAIQHKSKDACDSSIVFDTGTTPGTPMSSMKPNVLEGHGVDFFDIGDLKEDKAIQVDDDNLTDEMDAEDYQQLKGEWVPVTTLENDGLVKVEKAFVDSTAGVRVYLPRGIVGRVLRVDEEGDAEVRFPALSAFFPRERSRWILEDIFANLVMYNGKLEDKTGKLA